MSHDGGLAAEDPAGHPSGATWALGQPPDTIVPWSADPVAPPSPELGDLVAGRYRLQRRLGEGGYGEVFSARDVLSGEDVAVKLLHLRDDDDRVRARAEVTALRRLRLPGVVGFRDDGELAGAGPNWFVVMDLVEGSHFFQRRQVYAWSDIAAQVLALVETLIPVHLAGVVHRDLKPANILLDTARRPVLLDFGLAAGRAVADETTQRVAGTVQYMSPEQIRGQPVDARSDLFSLGAMLFEALSGAVPHASGSLQRMIRDRRDTQAPPLSSQAPNAPPEVARVVDWMLALDPGDRPDSAADVLKALGGTVPGLLSGDIIQGLPTDQRATPDDLRFLFAGPDPFFHFVEDGAAVLYMRTGGYPDRVRQELAAWTRAGLAHWDDGKLVLDRVTLRRLASELRLGQEASVPADTSADACTLLAWCRRAWPDSRPAVLLQVTGWSAERLAAAREELEALGMAWPGPQDQVLVRPVLPYGDGADARRRLARTCPPGSPLRLQHLEASGVEPRELLDETLRTVEGLRVEGRVADALAVLEPALALARSRRDPRRERALLLQFVKVSLAREDRGAADLALYELGRTSFRDGLVEQVELLVRACRAVVDRDGKRLAELQHRLTPFEDEDLEIWRVVVAVNAARMAGRHEWEQVLLEHRGWAHAGGAERRAKWSGWLGNLRYVQGRFEEAAELHLHAAREKRCLDARLASLVDAAWDLLDGQDFAQAEAVATEAVALARRLDHPVFEAQATAALRSSAYRAGAANEAQPDLVAAAAELSLNVCGQLALIEAANAWRRSDLGTARRLSTVSADAFERSGGASAARLAAALTYVLGGLDHQAGARLVQAALDGTAPGLDLQVLGLVGRREPALVAPHRDRMRALAMRRPPHEWPVRREVISLEEALAFP